MSTNNNEQSKVAVGDVVVVVAKVAKERNLPTEQATVTVVAAGTVGVAWPNGKKDTLPVAAVVRVLPRPEADKPEPQPAEAPKPEAKPKAEPKPKRRCACGCGELCLTPKARFLPGHDAKLDSALRRAVREGREPEVPEEAKDLVTTRACGHVTLYDHVACPCSQPDKPKASKDSGPTKAELQRQLTELQAQVAALLAAKEA